MHFRLTCIKMGSMSRGVAKMSSIFSVKVWRSSLDIERMPLNKSTEDSSANEQKEFAKWNRFTNLYYLPKNSVLNDICAQFVHILIRFFGIKRIFHLHYGEQFYWWSKLETVGHIGISCHTYMYIYFTEHCNKWTTGCLWTWKVEFSMSVAH